MKIFSLMLLALLTALPANALTSEQIIAGIKASDRTILARASEAEVEQVQKHNGVYFYIPRVLGARAIRSLFGCFDNKSSRVRKVCADSLYQLKLNYVHKKFVLFLLKKEKQPPVQMALQDIIVRMNEERFYAAREEKDGRFLMKISHDDLSVISEKGLPASRAFKTSDIPFLLGGLENPDAQVRSFCVKMLGRIAEGKLIISRVLTHLKTKEKSAAVRKEIDISLSCLSNTTSCPDIYLQDSHS